MAGLIRPETGLGDGDALPAETGWHIMQCSEVRDLPAADRFGNPKPRLLFVFRKYNPRLNTLLPDTSAYVCTASVFPGRGNTQPSNLFKWAQQVGYRNPENGVNPLHWVGRFFAVYTRETGKGSWAELHSPVEDPSGIPAAEREGWCQLAIETNPHYGREAKEPARSDEPPPF